MDHTYNRAAAISALSSGITGPHCRVVSSPTYVSRAVCVGLRSEQPARAGLFDTASQSGVTARCNAATSHADHSRVTPRAGSDRINGPSCTHHATSAIRRGRRPAHVTSGPIKARAPQCRLTGYGFALKNRSA